MIRRGFSLIELMGALLMASLVSLTLFQMMRSARTLVTRIQDVIQIDEPLLGFYGQLEKDVTGVFTPHSSLEAFIAQEQEQKNKQEGSFESVPIEPVFEVNAAAGQFFMSCITTGGIATLQADGSPAPIPFVRRAVYMLEPDPQRDGAFRLMYRMSGTQLDGVSAPSFTPSYELLNSITELSVELTVFKVQSDKDDAKEDDAPSAEEAKKDESPKPQTKQTEQPVSLTSWDAQAVWQEYKTLIPAYVRLHGTRVDDAGVSYPFDSLHRVYAYSPYVKKEQSLFEALEGIAQKIWKK